MPKFKDEETDAKWFKITQEKKKKEEERNNIFLAP